MPFEETYIVQVVSSLQLHPKPNSGETSTDAGEASVGCVLSHCMNQHECQFWLEIQRGLTGSGIQLNVEVKTNLHCLFILLQLMSFNWPQFPSTTKWYALVLSISSVDGFDYSDPPSPLGPWRSVLGPPGDPSARLPCFGLRSSVFGPRQRHQGACSTFISRLALLRAS